MANDKKSEIDISGYVDTEGLSTKKLEIGLWILNNKSFLYKALIIFLIFISGISWSYTIYGFAFYFVKGMRDDEKMTQELARSAFIEHNNKEIKDLVYTTPNIFQSSENKFDFITQIFNPNDNKIAYFDYCFKFAEREVGCDSDFIYPGDNKPIISLAQYSSIAPQNAQIALKSISWEKIDNRKIPDWKKFKDAHYDFFIENINFKPQTSAQSESEDLNSLSFIITNKTAYNYWEVPLEILLYNNSSLVGVNKFTLQEFISGEKRPISISWAGLIGKVSDLKIIPEVNIMNDNNYIKYEGGIGKEK